jgi:hypothetical protein
LRKHVERLVDLIHIVGRGSWVGPRNCLQPVTFRAHN